MTQLPPGACAICEKRAADGGIAGGASHVLPRRHRLVRGLLLGVLALAASEWQHPACRADEAVTREILSKEQWSTLDSSTDRALAYLAKRQRPDGSFEAPDQGQPGITSLCVMAFLSRGHVPSSGQYGAQIEKGIDFVLGVQQPDGYLFNPKNNTDNQGTYNHAISGLMLGEVYGMTEPKQRERIRNAILKALQFTRSQQLLAQGSHQGGWRYVTPNKRDADLSVTAWHIMFLRSARNAEFEVPQEYIEEAMKYVRRTFWPEQEVFMYKSLPASLISRATCGSGILMLSLGGEHQTEMARKAGKWILRSSFERFNQSTGGYDRYYYSAYYCSQGMFQLGGDYWAKFYPPLLRTLLKNQRPDGSWPPESHEDTEYGDSYTTALVVLTLTPPYQLLPIYQR